MKTVQSNAMSDHDIPRRKVIKYSGLAGAVGIAGCTGGGGSGDGSSGDGGGGDESSGDGGGDGSGSGGGGGSGTPEKPWEIEQLSQMALDAGQTDLMWYNTGGAQQTDAKIMDFINNEFGGGDFNIEALLVKDQRMLQELQSGNVKADAAKAAEEARELGLDKVAVTLEDKLAIVEDAPDWAFENRQFEWKAGGAAYSIVYNTELLTGERLSLLKEKQWNALLEAPFEGTVVVQDYTPKLKYIGAVLKTYSEKAGMEPLEWLQAIKDNVEFTFSDGHSAGVRVVGQGSADLQFLGYPNHILEFGAAGKGLPVDAVLPPKEDIIDFHSQRSIIPKNAPNPIGGLFLAAASMHPKTQEFIANETPYRPGRVDLDYPDADEFKQFLLNAVGEDAKVSMKTQKTYEDLAEQAFADVFGSPSPDY